MNNTNEQTITNTSDFTLDDIYFKDAFTKTANKLNLEVDNANISCLSSKNNKFSLDEDGNLVVNSVTYNESNIPEALNFNQIYPVGSVYISVTNTNPSILFGGIWEQIKDTFLLSAGDTHEAGSTGGEESHTLTVDEMPTHKHDVGAYGYNNMVKTTICYTDLNSHTHANKGGHVAEAPKNSANGSYTLISYDTGGSKSHNNMPPYLVVYMWKRTQ